MTILIALLLGQANVYFHPDTLLPRLVRRIDAAQTSLDFCVYQPDTAPVADALIRARARGVRVRVITDDDQLGAPWVPRLRAAGIPVFSDSACNPSSIMHNKFLVCDYGDADAGNDWLLTGSYNATCLLHADNIIEVQDSGLAHAYTQEFVQMWGSTDTLPNARNGKFHNDKRHVNFRREFVIGTDTFRLFFAPQDNPVVGLSQRVGQARTEIGFGAYSFTRTEGFRALSDSMVAAFSRGAWVGGVFDERQTRVSSAYWYLRDTAGLPVYTDLFLGAENLLHEKIMVIDGRITVTGSFNWSGSANSGNDENLLIISSPAITARYRAEIVARLAEAGGSYPAAWSVRPQLPAGPKGRRLRYGGALAADDAGGTGTYAFKGSGTCEFYRFDREPDAWTSLDPIPLTGRTGRAQPVKRGGTLTAVGGRLYATKGGSLEFWQYLPTGIKGSGVSLKSSSWLQVADVPTGKSPVKTGAAAAGGQVGIVPYVFLLKGGNSVEFLGYEANHDRWFALTDAPLGSSGRGFGTGSCLAFDGLGTLYVLKGRVGEFYAYDAVWDMWHTLAPLPDRTNGGQGKPAGAGAAMVYDQGRIVLLKGNRSDELWVYDCAANTWTPGRGLPVGTGRFVGDGAAMARSETDNAIYVLRGDRTLDFWEYGPLHPGANSTPANPQSETFRTPHSALRILDVSPAIITRDAQTVVRYSLAHPAQVQLKLYNVDGRLVSALTMGRQPAGEHTVSPGHWDLVIGASRAARGVYVLQLEAGAGRASTKVAIQ